MIRYGIDTYMCSSLIHFHVSFTGIGPLAFYISATVRTFKITYNKKGPTALG